MSEFSENSFRIGGGYFGVIAGPCSIESEQQFLKTALSVKASGAGLLRGGIWKMRTSPDSFQGLGGQAISLVKNVLNQSKIGLVCEITDPRQIPLLDDFVAMYQVGARNMYNYSLLKELGQTRKPVLLKRSFAALLSEWLKAADYIEKGGNKNIILCERGIRTFETSSRYTFDLNSVLLAKAESRFPVIVDPSHAIGLSEHVPALARAAAAAGADGMIIEVHPDPAKALSDGRQSLNLLQFADLMKDLEKILAVVNKKIHRPMPNSVSAPLNL